MLRLFDSLTRAVEPITPARPGTLTVYACGPALDRAPQVADLRSSLLPDLLSRTGSLLDLRVRVVQSTADSGEYEDAFRRDLALLNVHPAQAYARASECLDLMVRMMERLLDQGHAYLGADGVFFAAHTFPAYGKLSDWPLWTTAVAKGGTTWDSPWGRGILGPHLACSAMALGQLGTTIDVHTGGVDLRFPHHEAVRAQSDCFAGSQVVRHWVHSERLLPGGPVLLSDVIDEGYDPLSGRLALLSSSYRQPVELTWDSIAEAQQTLTRWRELVTLAAESPSAPIDVTVRADVLEAFSDDLDTPRALQVLQDFVTSAPPPGCLFETFAWADRLLGLDLARDVGRAPV